jgi:cell wall-associated NlpC family hydrolase
MLVPAAASAHPWHDPNAHDGSDWIASTSARASDAPADSAPAFAFAPGPEFDPGKLSDDPWAPAPALPISTRPTVAGKTAVLRPNGLAAVPMGAPASVQAVITAANQIIGKPYKWGGGHGRLFDSGYDCSGSISYALIGAGILSSPMVSRRLAQWGATGVGTYLTIYANKSHAYMEVAGLRLDTSSIGDPGGTSGVQWRPPIGKRFGFAVRHVSGL